jgi:DNA-binding NtrC family response regulator
MGGSSDDETRTLRRSPEAASAAAYALFVSSPAGTEVIPLRGRSSFVLGRGASCDIVVRDPSLSREHALLSLADDVRLQDLGSKNGTRADGQWLAPGKPRVLSAGSTVELGSAMLILQRVNVATLPARATATAVPMAAQQKPPSYEGPAGCRTLDESGPKRERGSKRADPNENDGPIVEDPTMRHLYAMLDVVAPSQLSVLILGETGTGKEVYAAEVHRRSPRATRPFVAIHCAALPESLLEAELFGYEKGAFTGATRAKAGLFEAADGGTVFLDEVGDIPLAIQVKLLRVLETGEVLRLGSVEPSKVDVRFVAATHRDLRALVAAQQFRADLYFRVNGISITLPPLRNRRADIAPLARRFARRAAAAAKKGDVLFSQDAIDRLEAHDWPGNVRELRNVLERAVVLCTDRTIDPQALFLADDERFPAAHAPNALSSADALATSEPMYLPARPSEARDRACARHSAPSPAREPAVQPETAADLKRRAREAERQELVDALKQCGGNQSRAATRLGISRFTLMSRMETYGLARPRKRH